jgi:hypothetical protein
MTRRGEAAASISGRSQLGVDAAVVTLALRNILARLESETVRDSALSTP